MSSSEMPLLNLSPLERPRSSSDGQNILPHLPASARALQRVVTPPIKSARSIHNEAVDELRRSEYQEPASLKPMSTNGTSSPKSPPLQSRSAVKLPPLMIQPSRSFGDLPVLDTSFDANSFPPSDQGPLSRTPSMWGDGLKSPSPTLSMSRQESFNIPQHRLAIFDTNKQLRRPRSPADVAAHQPSMKNLLKASLTPKASNESFFGTVDAETVAINVAASSDMGDEREDDHKQLRPTLEALMEMPPIERALSNISISDAETISASYSSSSKMTFDHEKQRFINGLAISSTSSSAPSSSK